MHTITWTDLKRMTVAQAQELLPLTVTVETMPAFVFDLPENIITLSDLHPRVRTQLRAAELRARKGMPEAQRVYTAPEPMKS